MERAGLSPEVLAELAWRGQELAINIVEGREAVEELSHDQIRDIVKELGELKGCHAETERPIDGGRLDAVWKELPGGSPSEAFEVQIGGNIYGALVKLRYARALWPGAGISLVVPEEENEEARGEARRLPAGRYTAYNKLRRHQKAS